MRRSLLWVCWIIACAFIAQAQRADTRQQIFNPNFRSLQIRVNDSQLAVPVIALNSSDRLQIVFDEIADDRSYLRYELIHCDRSWQPDALIDSEFLDGFNVAEVEDYDFSRATLIHYVNYRITLPNPEMQIKASGNYLVRVYPEDDPDQTILQARFCVSENMMAVEGDVTTRTDIDTNSKHQQLEFVVDTGEYPVENIYDDLLVTVTRNGDPASEITVTHPLRVQGKKAVYEHLRPLIFPAGNEFRRFEAITTRFPGIGIAAVEHHDPLYHFFLNTDEVRAFDRYNFDRTQHGRFFIREYNSALSDTEADYVMVHFTLSMPKQQGREVHIYGDLTNRLLSEGSRMTYDSASGAYTLSLPLKQGAYNYQYALVPSQSANQAAIDNLSAIEGDFHETSNEYLIKVYHRPRGSRYDRLVAATVVYAN